MNKRILFFINSLTGGGAERVTSIITHFLVDKGYSVGIITVQGTDSDFYTLPKGIDRISLDLAGENRGIGKVFANIQRLLALRAVLKQEQADVVVGMITTSAILCILAGWGLSTRVVASERNYPGSKPCRLIWAILRRLIYRFADQHVVQTHKIANWLKENTGSQNIKVIPNSVKWPIPRNTPVIEPRLLLKKDERVILAVGTKLHQKGFDLLIDAFAKIAHSHSGWRLVIIGISQSSNEGILLIELAKQLRIYDQVILPGLIGNVGDWYQRADLFVLSSRYEGMPNVLLEAMATGCACIAFDCDTGPRDIIEQGVNGLLVPAEDVDALRYELNRLILNPNERKMFSEAAIDVRGKFSEARIMDMWSKVLF